MKKRILVLVVGFLLIGINAFAADGDLVVNGNATVNNNLTVQGTIQGIKLVHVTGTNPTCPSGTGAFVMRKFNARTCTDNAGGGCTIPAGWGVNPTCTTIFCYEGNCSPYATCPGTNCTCYAEAWTEAVCMGN
jgi:hypothetical protein